MLPRDAGTANDDSRSTNLADPHRAMELSGGEFQALATAAMERLVNFLDTLPRQPAQTPLSPECSTPNRLQEIDFPKSTSNVAEVLDDLFQRLIPPGYNSAAPGYFGYVPGGGLPAAAIADLISDTVNRFVGLRQAAPWLAAIDRQVLTWFHRMVGFPETAGGYLSPGGSLANLMAVITARHDRLGDEHAMGTVYTSDQAHHSILKAAWHAGIRREQVRRIPSQLDGRVDITAVRQTIADDRRRGFQPFLLVGQAGTTNTGSVDDLTACHELARDESLWFHVDAAYGGFFLMTDRGQRALRGVASADSVTLDPHKSLFLPYGTGCLLVRNADQLRAACDVRGDYLPTRSRADEWDACDLSPELSRDFRGLRIWLPMQLYGAEAFRALLDEKLDLARNAYRQLAASRDEGMPWHLEAEPRLSLFPFRLQPEGLSGVETDQLNHRLLEMINRSDEVFLSGTTFQGRWTLRLCVLSFRSHREHVNQAVSLITTAAEQLLACSNRSDR